MSIRDTVYAGRLTITSPAPASPTTPVLPGHGVTLTDFETGDPIRTALDCDIRIPVRPDEIVTAVLTMLTDADGKPLANDAKPQVADDGETFRTGEFTWLVAEMRVADE